MPFEHPRTSSLVALVGMLVCGCSSSPPSAGSAIAGASNDAAVTDVGGGSPEREVDAETSADVSPADDASQRSADTCPDWRCDGHCADLIPMPGVYCNTITDPDQHTKAYADGYCIVTEARYAFIQRHIALLIQHAACEIHQAAPDIWPLGLDDMSQADGHTPGTDVGALRHPAGAHENGTDIDISYFTTDGKNNGAIVCGDGSDTTIPGKYNDGSFCTTDQNIVEWPREVRFMAFMALSPQVRITGVDRTFLRSILDGAQDLADDGVISDAVHQRILLLGAGVGWPLHFHHTHHSFIPPTGAVSGD